MYSAKVTDCLLNHNVSVFGKGWFVGLGIFCQWILEDFSLGLINRSSCRGDGGWRLQTPRERVMSRQKGT